MSQTIRRTLTPSEEKVLLARTPPVFNLADVQPNVTPAPLPKAIGGAKDLGPPITIGSTKDVGPPVATGTAKDLGPPITTTVTVKFGGVEGSNGVSGTGLQVGAGVKVPLGKDTTLTGDVSVGWYNGNSGGQRVQGRVTRVQVGLNQNIPTDGYTKWNVGVRAGMETDHLQGSPATTSADFTVSVGFTRPLLDGPTKVNLFGDASVALNFAATTQIRPRVQLGVKVTNGPFSASLAGSVQARVNLNGPNAGEIAAIIPVASAEIGYKVSKNVTVFAAGTYTLYTDRNASSRQFFGTSSNPGWGASGGIRLEF
jgi:hypothetical protein